MVNERRTSYSSDLSSSPSSSIAADDASPVCLGLRLASEVRKYDELLGVASPIHRVLDHKNGSNSLQDPFHAPGGLPIILLNARLNAASEL